MSDQPRLKKMRTLIYLLLSTMCTFFILTDAAFAADRADKYFSCKLKEYFVSNEKPKGDIPNKNYRESAGNCPTAQYEACNLTKNELSLSDRDAQTLCSLHCIEFNIDYNKVSLTKSGRHFVSDNGILIRGDNGYFALNRVVRLVDFGEVFTGGSGTCKIKYYP